MMLLFDMMTIGNRLLAARKRLGMTQAEVAERAGLSDRTYADIERGGVNMRIETFLRICQTLSVSPDDILTEERDVAFATSDNRVLCFNTELLRIKTTNNTQGVQAMTVKGTRHVLAVGQVEEFIGANVDANRFRAASLPSPGAPIREQDQKSLFD